MDGFAKFWDANAMMIGIAGTVLAVGIAIVLRHGTLASVIGLIGGMALMWVGKPAPAIDTGDED